MSTRQNLKGLILMLLVLVSWICKVDVVYADRVDELIKQLKDEDWWVRDGAAEALGEIKDKRAVEPLIAALRDKESVVRWEAAEALGNIGDKRAVEPLKQTLEDENRYVQVWAAYGLYKLGDTQKIEFIIAALRDENSWVRKESAETLGKIGDKRAVEPLIAALRDKDEYVRNASKEALEKITGKNFGVVSFGAKFLWGIGSIIGAIILVILTVKLLKLWNRFIIDPLREKRLKKLTELKETYQFYTPSERPQIKEILEAPETSIYGGIITIWISRDEGGIDLSGPLFPHFKESSEVMNSILKFLQRDIKGKIHQLMVTGHAETSICHKVSCLLETLDLQLGHKEQDLLVSGAGFFDLKSIPEDNNLVESILSEISKIASCAGLVSIKECSVKEYERIYNDIAKSAEKREGYSPKDANVKKGFSVLVPFYRLGGKNRILTVSLPSSIFDIRQFESVCEEYRRVVKVQLLKDAQIRLSKYQHWKDNWEQSQKRLEHMRFSDPTRFSKETVTIHFTVDFITATERRIDPPDIKSASQYLQELPHFIQEGEQWIKRMEELIKQVEKGYKKELSLHDKACLIDSLIRGCRLPFSFSDPKLDEVVEKWHKEQGKLVRYVLVQKLKSLNIDPSILFIENVIFKINIKKKSKQITLTPLFLYDPRYDKAIPDTKSKLLRYYSAWGERICERLPYGQTFSVAERFFEEGDWKSALSLGVEEITNEILLYIKQKSMIHSDFETGKDFVKSTCLTRNDPIAILDAIRGYSTVAYLYNFLQDDWKKIQLKYSEVPDIYLFKMFWLAVLIRNISSSIQDPWDIIQEIVKKTAYRSLNKLQTEILDTYKKAMKIDADYITKCINNREFSVSDERKSLLPENYLSIEDRALLYILKGDECFSFAIQLQKVYDAILQGEDLKDVYSKIKKVTISSPINYNLLVKQNQLQEIDLIMLNMLVNKITEMSQDQLQGIVEGRLDKSGDLIMQNMLVNKITEMSQDIVQEALNYYNTAIRLSTKYIEPIYRLATLQYWLGNFREALMSFIGSVPQCDILQTQLTLGLSIRLLGGSIIFNKDGDLPEDLRGQIKVNHSGDILEFQVTFSDGSDFQAQIQRLDQETAQLLAEYFRKYNNPQYHKVLGVKSFSEWFSHILIPSIGKRGQIAQKVWTDMEKELVVSSVYLGVSALNCFYPELKLKSYSLSKSDIVRTINWNKTGLQE